MSICGSIVGIIILIIRKILDNKIAPKWKCIMWWIFILILLNPFKFEIETNFKHENILIKNLETISEIPKDNITENIEDDILESSLNVSDFMTSNTNDNQEKISTNQIKSYSLTNILKIYVIPYIWFIIFIIFIASFIISYFSIIKKLKNNKCDDIIVNSILKKDLRIMKINKNIGIYYQNFNNSTSIFGVINSKILISKEILSLNDESLKYVFLHELAHFKRKDLIFNLIMLFALSIHFFNPFVWYAFKKIREDIELAADEYVISVIGKDEKKKYGLTLINLLELNRNNRYAVNFLCISDTEKNMERRIKMIKNPFKRKIFSAIFVILFVVIISGIVFVKSTGKENIFPQIENGIELLSQDYEHLWTEPKVCASYEEYSEILEPAEEYAKGSSRDITEEEKQNLISEEKAKKIAKEITDKIGYTSEEITSIKLEKYMLSCAKYDYQIRTTNGLYIYINAENGKFEYFRYDNLIKQKFENEDMSDKDVKTFVLNLYKSFDFLEQDYEFYKCNANITAMGEGDSDSSDYKQYTKEEYTATFYKKQNSGVLNKYNYIAIAFYIVDGKALISCINCGDEVEQNNYYKNIEYIAEDNEVVLTEEQAIKIAEDKDFSIFPNKNIKNNKAKLITNETNYTVWVWENGYKYEDLYETVEFEDNSSSSYPKYYYDKYYIRNTYEVTVFYDVSENEDVYDDDSQMTLGNIGRVYYIDATTGEILGGRALEIGEDVRLENDYLFDENDNYITYKTTYYDAETSEILYELNYELSDETKAQFYIKKDEKPNTVSYNIY